MKSGARKLLLLSGLVLFYLPRANAAQTAVVTAEPAYIYKKPDFDAQQISQLAVNQKVQVSNKKFGPFYRVRLKQGVLGYISDADVQILGKDSRGPKPFDANSESMSKRDQRRRGPWWNSFMLGAAAGMVRYTEVISKVELKDSLLYYGAKVSMPLRILDGPFSLDIAALYHSGAPSYYNSLSEVAPTGFFFNLETSALFTLFHFWQGDGAFYIGAGPLVTYSSFKTVVSQKIEEVSEVRIGAVATAGLAFSLGRVVLKLEPRYYLEKASYFGFLGAVQMTF